MNAASKLSIVDMNCMFCSLLTMLDIITKVVWLWTQVKQTFRREIIWLMSSHHNTSSISLSGVQHCSDIAVSVIENNGGFAFLVEKCSNLSFNTLHANDRASMTVFAITITVFHPIVWVHTYSIDVVVSDICEDETVHFTYHGVINIEIVQCISPITWSSWRIW